MRNLYLFSSLLLLFAFISSCNNNEIKVNPKNNQILSNPVFKVSNKDSLPSGIPIQIKGRVMNPESLKVPSNLPSKTNPKVIPVPTNKVKAGQPKELIVEQKTISISKQSTLEKIPMTTKVIPAGQPKSIPALPPQITDKERSSIYSLDMSNGMSSSVVVDMIQDQRGDFWITTYGQGIMRYSGQQFEYYTTEEGLPINTTFMAFEDKKGHLWFSYTNGFMRYDGVYFTLFNFVDNLILEAQFIEDQKGKLWLTARAGTYSFEPPNEKTDTVYLTKHSSEINLFVVEDQEGDIWFNSKEGLIREKDGEHTIIYQAKDIGPLFPTFNDHEGNIWFTTFNQGIVKFDGKRFLNFTTNEGLHNNWIYRIFQDKQGLYYFGGWHRGISIFDGKEFTHLTTNNIRLGNIRSIIEDDPGNIWIGLYGGGVNLLHHNRLTHYFSEDGLPEAYVSQSILEDSKGNYWFKSLNEICYFDGNTMFNYPQVSDFLKAQFWLDEKKNLCFIGADRSLIRINPQNLSKNDELLKLSGTWWFTKDHYDNLWFARARYESGGNHFIYCHNGENVIEYPIESTITNMLTDKRGDIWLACGGGPNGMYRFRPTQDGQSIEITKFTSQEGLIHNMVWTNHEDHEGNLWFATMGGLSRLDYDQLEKGQIVFKNYTSTDGLSHTYTLGINQDSLNRLWVTTLDGVSVIKPLANDEYQIYTLKREDGFNGTSIVGSYLDSKNHLWFGSSQNVSRLDLNRFRLPESAPKVRLHTLEINQQFIDYRKLANKDYVQSHTLGKFLQDRFDSVAAFFNYPLNLKLPHHLDHLKFDYSATDWYAPQKLRFSFILEGNDEDWSPYQAITSVEYRNLSPGFYTFKIKAKGASLNESDTFEYSFRILPPWWQTIWAYIGYALIIGALAYFLYQYLLNQRLAKEEAKRLKELDSVKTKLYTNISHEFRTPLTVIAGMSDKIKENPRKWAMEGTNLITRNSKHLLKLVNQILDLRKLESGTLKVNLIQADIVAYVQYLLQSFQSLAEDKNIQIHFYAEKKELMMDFDPDKMQHIISNLVSNAVKFTPKGGNVYVSIQRSGFSVLSNGHSNNKGPFLFIKVRDTGIGIEEEKLAHIFDRFYQVDDSSTRQGEGTGIGLALTKELVQLLNGDISVKSEVGNNTKNTGTEFTILLPISNDAILEENIVFSKESSGSATIPIAPSPTVSRAIASSSKPLALIIEDNADVAKYLFTCLEDDYQLLWSKNGQEGIDKAIEATPDIIISDVMMPQKDGFEVCQELKQNLRTSHIPIILLTAKADLDSKLEGLSHGADAYLAKPFNQQELNIRLQKLIELRQQLQNHYSQYKISKGKSKNLEEEFLIKLQEQIFQNLADENFGVIQLSRKMAMSRSQLFRKIKALTNKSTSSYIRTLRLSKACELLKTTDLNISEIAYKVGFSNPVYFTQAFSEEFGIPPSKVRQ